VRIQTEVGRMRTSDVSFDLCWHPDTMYGRAVVKKAPCQLIYDTMSAARQ